MSETAKWQVYGQMGAGWFVGGTDPATPTSEEIDGFLCLGPAGAEMAAEFLNSLETSLVEVQAEAQVQLIEAEQRIVAVEHALAEAQKERDALVEDKPFALWPRWVDEARSRAEAAEQQLAEVKEQLRRCDALGTALADGSPAVNIEALNELLRNVSEGSRQSLDRAMKAEQQLAEVKAQLDAQAGVIRELTEALDAIVDRRNVQIAFAAAAHDGAFGDEEEWRTEYERLHNPEDTQTLFNEATIALAHVREPETK